MSRTEQEDGFLARWSRRKAQVREGVPPAETAALASPDNVAMTTAAAPVSPLLPAAPISAQPATQAHADAAELETPLPQPPTLADVAELTRESDYARFVGRGVEPQVRNAALKKLFTDPHFNIMDGLDTYIDDYGKPDPIPDGMLRQMTQSKFLGLFKEEEDEAERQAALAHDVTGAGAASDLPTSATSGAAPLSPATPETTTDENPDLRLQPHDAARRPGPEPGAGQDSGREC